MRRTGALVEPVLLVELGLVDDVAAVEADESLGGCGGLRVASHGSN